MHTNVNTGWREESRIKTMVITALWIALTYVFTAFINIRLPFMGNGGLIHLGNVPLFLSAMLYGKKTGALSGGLGMALFDVTSGWMAWSPFTLLIAGCMGYVTGYISEKKSSTAGYGAAIFISGIIKICGYYLAEGILYGNWIAPLGSIPGNTMQIVAAAILVLPAVNRLKKAKEKINV